jgi:putative membrane protein
MKNLMRKELVLAMHPASMLFLLLSAMLLIPNYPYYVICFYTCLGTFFICLTGRENRDIEFTALLPVRKTDLVRARVFTVMLMQLAQLVIAVSFAVFSSRVSAENLVGMDANTAFFGFALVLYGVFNLVFFRNYYRAPGKVGKAFGWGCGALTLCMVVFEACAHTVPFVRDRLDTPDPAFLGEKLTLLAAGAALYVLLSALALRRAMHSFAALDL